MISCPCALALATPVALTSAVASLRARGVLVHGDNALMALADANHLLGVLAKRSGDKPAAIELISRAIATDRNQAMYHNNLGSVFGEMGRLEEAAASYRKAIALKPDFP